MSIILNQQFSATQSQTGIVPTTVVAQDPTSVQAVFADFAKRLQNIEQNIKANNVGADNILSQIELSPEAILISSSKIGIVGQVTFADWHRDVTGAATGSIDPSITQIRGGVIKTGIIENLTATSYINLDATGATPFIVSSSGVSIEANGNFTLGSGTSVLGWNGTTLTIGSSTVTSGTGNSIGTIDSNASTALSNASTAITNANTAITTANNALSVANAALSPTSNYVLQGTVQLPSTAAGGIEAGSVTWNASTGAVTGGTGVVFTQNGITAVNNGATTFLIDKNGNATYAGALSAATGTFAGSLSAASGTFTGTLSSVNGTFTGQLVAATGTFSGSLSAATGTFSGSVSAGAITSSTTINVNGSLTTASGSQGAIQANSSYGANIGVIGWSGIGGVGVAGGATNSGSYAVFGYSTDSSSPGVYAENTAGGYALQLYGTMNHTGVTPISGSVAFTNTNAPSGHTVLQYLPFYINGTLQYLVYV